MIILQHVSAIGLESAFCTFSLRGSLGPLTQLSEMFPVFIVNYGLNPVAGLLNANCISGQSHERLNS